MTHRLSNLRSHARAWLRREDGNAAVGFALVFPLFFALFAASFEIGLFTVRQTILERAVDITVRAIRLNQMTNPNHATIKDMICRNAPSLTDCGTTLKVDLTRVATTTWTMPVGDGTCRDRSLPIDPPGQVDPNPQARQVLMVMRVCYIAEAIFPGTGIAAGLQRETHDIHGVRSGGYRMLATTAFLNEP
ncbi:MAG: pilus assembly protein [Gemmobacter sp.]|uniref:TadE/TadG family type IV pilus assembly protein n=1 Tax=Gemmobacter sp. TaxID=1898957 RepID=UPI001A59170A|nr:TadE/TadG family type IV pilus assembly protein [Gemmobacter sp.]MBL8561315.1 pilus assembly protein [Gemmobacter sp.]